MRLFEFNRWRTGTRVLFLMLIASLLMFPFMGHYPGMCLLTTGSILILLLTPHVIRDYLFQVGIYVHEICHGVGGIVTGSTFDSFQIETESNGWALSLGGNRTVIVSAGYIGTTLIGCLMLLATPLLDVGTTRLIFYSLSALCMNSLIKAVGHRTRIVAVLLATMLFASAAYTGTLVAFIIMNLLGIILIWQGITWILYLLGIVKFSSHGTDAHTMAGLHGGTPGLWAKFFLGVSFSLIAAVLLILSW